MDAETEVVPTGTEASERDGMDTDDGLDKLLRKAVTVSQANLPIAAIDKDIDDIASACAKENERPENAIDDDFVKLLERTRQRRELLDKKIGKGPDAAPRKRRSPLTEDLTSNVGGESAQTEDSPKRQCVREKESAVKPDTPAIASVKSRLQALSTQRAHWAEEGTENQGDSSPVPTPRKSMAVSPPVEQTSSADQSSRTQPSSQRKNRFAQLASNISSWEDDLSHPTIVKEEEKKPRWQPPKATENSDSAQFSSTKASHDYIPTAASKKSPKKTVTSMSSESDKLASGSPAKPGTKSGNGDVPSVKPSASSLLDSSKPAECQNVKEVEAQHEKESEPGHQADVEESRSSRANTSRMEKEIEKHSEMKKDSSSNKQEETKRESLKSASHRREPETPKVLVPPTDRPLSARLANWEQKISDNKSDTPCTPKTTVATPGRVTHPPKECTPARPISTAPVEESEAVQMRPKTRRAAEDEPTAHSVSARMSAWEHISSAQVVSSIKKVNPGDCSPLKTPATQKSPSKNSAATPAKTCTKDGIKERIAQLNTPNKASNTPSKSQAVGSATRSAHWQPAQQSHCSDMAQRLRQERMAEVQGIQNRWKNGILKDDKDVPPAEPSKPESLTKNDKRQGAREKARADDSEEPSEISVAVHSELLDKSVRIISNHEMGEENLPMDSQGTTVNSEAIISDPTGGVTDEEKLVIDQEKLKETCKEIDCEGTTVDHRKKEPLCPAFLRDAPTVESLTTKLEADQKETRTDCSTDQNLGEAAVQKMKLDQNLKIREHEGRMDEDGSTLQVDEPMDCSDGEEFKTDMDSRPADSANVVDDQKNIVVEAETNQAGYDDAPVDILDSQAAGTEDKKEQVSAELPQGSCASNFQNRLATIGLDECNKEKAQDSEETAPKSQSVTSTTSVTSTAVTGKPPRPTSLFTIVSQQKAEVAACSPRPVSTACASKACRKVKFDDSFDSEDFEPPLPKKQTTLPETHTKAVADNSETNDEVEVVLRRPPPASRQPPPKSDDDDDVSLSAFVPRSVRFESVLPSGSRDMNTSINSLDSFEGAPGAPPDFHKSTVDLVKLGQQYADSDTDSDTDTCNNPETADSTSQNRLHQSQTLDHIPQDMEESVDDREAIADLLDEAMDSDSDEAPSTSSAKPPVPVMRKKTNRTDAAGSGDLPFSINEYRASRNMQIQEVKQTIVRNSQYVGKAVKEEDVEMPSPVPTPAPRRSVQERIKELQELVQQEQSVIMQTSNALNQCCYSSYFAGSSEQVECNRILLLSCQKRQAYMTEIQRLKDSSVLDTSGPGPKGSLTISDIRLPLKKEFVTKIGTSQDTMTYYFILLLKNGPQVISTQMLSTHDPMMRGSLDFPNLIKINGITGSFKLQLEIYSMSISCEASGKDKKKKTPKKIKGSALTVQSPGGPMAVRTTSFTQVTTVLLTMKSVDKHSFTLDRLSHLSPLHGTIYMNLKCLMEANVEEKGFLTMFEDVSGLGSWHRRWCALGGNKLQFWKYPDDETRKEPMGYIDLKRCVTEKVGLISRDICARPHTFELTTVRQPQKGEKDTLISRTYSTMTTVRHMLSADTKEERIVWCNKINRALATLRTWHADAMRPIPK